MLRCLIFKRKHSLQDLGFIETTLLTKDILSRTNCTTTLTDLRTKFENAFHSEFEERTLMQTQEDFTSNQAVEYDSLKQLILDVQTILFLCSEKEKSNSETASQISKGMQLELMNTRYVDTFTSTMLLNIDQLQKQLDKDEFQEDGSMAAFWVIHYLTLGNVKKSVAERTRHQRQTDSTVQDDSSRSGNDTDADDADIRPIYDESQWLRWIPQESYSTSLTHDKVDSEPPHGLNVDNPHDSMNANKFSGWKNLRRFKPRTTMSIEVHQAAETVTTSNELDVLFGPLFDEYFNGENQVVLKSSAVTTTDASNKRQQQPDSTSSTSTLATSVTANGNFDLTTEMILKYLQLKMEFLLGGNINKYGRYSGSSGRGLSSNIVRVSGSKPKLNQARPDRKPKCQASKSWLLQNVIKLCDRRQSSALDSANKVSTNLCPIWLLFESKEGHSLDDL
ncbi:hypothetical protein Tco_0527833 [Tanacetum coccineum]